MVIRWNGLKARRARRNSGIVAADVQQLESRALLAGNVSVSFSSGTLTIKGDNSSNEIDVVIGEGTVTITGVDTTINGEEDPLEIEFDGKIDKDVKIDMKGGDDVVKVTVEADVEIGRNLKVDMGKGDDSLVVLLAEGVQVTVGNDVDIKLGSGSDGFYFDGEAGFTETISDNPLYIKDDLSIDGGSGEDGISIDGGIGVKDDAKIKGGSDSDGIAVDDLNVGDDLTIDGGSGHDVIGISDIAAGDDAKLKGGSGNDCVNVDGDVLVGDDLDVDLGSGDDDLVVGEGFTLAVGDDAKIDGGSGDDDGPGEGFEEFLDAAVADKVTVKRFEGDEPDECPSRGDIEVEIEVALGIDV